MKLLRAFFWQLQRMFASCQRTSASTSTTRCSGRAASWLPITVHCRGITQTRRYSHTSKPSRCDLLKPGSQILRTPDRTHFRLSGWGRRLGGVGLFQALVQPCSGAGGHGGADHIDVLKDIVNNCDVGPFRKKKKKVIASAPSPLWFRKEDLRFITCTRESMRMGQGMLRQSDFRISVVF